MISSGDSLSLKEKTITITHDKKPSFAEITVGKMLAAIPIVPLGVTWMIHDGNKLIRENNISDPAAIISNDLADKFRKSYKSKIVDEKEVMDTNISVEEMSDRYRNSSDYVLDIRTINWSLNYAQYKTDRYHTLYSSKLRLIDVKAKRIIAEGFCSSQTINPQSYNWFVKDNATALKDVLKNLASFCSASLGKSVLGFE
jgi:hypothetical protein